MFNGDGGAADRAVLRRAVPAFAGKAPAVAVAVAIVFAALQWRGIVWGSNIQNLTSLLKALAFLALIAAAFILGSGGSFTTYETYSIPISLALIVPIVFHFAKSSTPTTVGAA